MKSLQGNQIPPLSNQGRVLRKGIQDLNRQIQKMRFSHSLAHHSVNRLALLEQPFDRLLLSESRLYRKSRQLYIQIGGEYLPTLVTSPRSLSSALLLDSKIEYSPIEKELIWSAVDPIESRHPSRLLELRTYSTNVFHEQNHRILWKFLPSAPSQPSQVRRYLNFAESLVITLDMALGDELSSDFSMVFYLMGIQYDPGTSVRRELNHKRSYRNYLQAVLFTTYLHLEGYSPEVIEQVIDSLYPNREGYTQRAFSRGSRLDRSFIMNTNLAWQKRNMKTVIQKLHRPKASQLLLLEDPTNHCLQYLWAEKVFDLVGI